MTISEKKEIIKKLFYVYENIGKKEKRFVDDDGNFLREEVIKRDDGLKFEVGKIILFLTDDIDQEDEVAETKKGE